MNCVWDLAWWTFSEQWDCVLRVRFTYLTLLAVAVVLAAGAAFMADCRRREGVLADRPRVVFFGVSVFGLALLCVSGDTLTFYLGWGVVGLASIVLNPRDSKADGVALSTIRWAPGQLSGIALLAAIILLHAVFRTTDWTEMARMANEVSGYSRLRVIAILGLSALAAWLPFFFAPAHREDLFTPFQFWCRNAAVPLSAFMLLHRVHFLALLHPVDAATVSILLFLCATAKTTLPIARPGHRLSLTAFGVGVGALLCGACLGLENPEPWVLRIGVLSTIAVVAAAIRLGRPAWEWKAPEASPVREKLTPGLWGHCTAALRGFDKSFWDGLWQVPVRLTHALGGAFVYWQGNSAQYTLVVILIGTLVLFWAALKTQVIW
jgi:hypothetical protein